MTRRIRQTRARQGWSIRQIAHLLSGQDWQFITGGGWGHLSDLPIDELRVVIGQMQSCWDDCEPQGLVTAEHCGMNPGDEPPWFAQFAGPEGNERLFGECHKRRAYMEYQRANRDYRPYAEFEQQYVSPVSK